MALSPLSSSVDFLHPEMLLKCGLAVVIFWHETAGSECNSTSKNSIVDTGVLFFFPMWNFNPFQWLGNSPTLCSLIRGLPSCGGWKCQVLLASLAAKAWWTCGNILIHPPQLALAVAEGFSKADVLDILSTFLEIEMILKTSSSSINKGGSVDHDLV